MAQFWQKGQLTLVNGSISSTVVHIAFQNTVHGSFFREKQTAVHIAFQTRVHGSFFFFLEKKQTAVHIALQNIVHDSFSREKQTAVHMAFRNTVHRSLLEKNRPSCI